MATDPNLLRALKSNLRRRYASDIVGLKREADRVFPLATETVTVTTHSFVDGSATGEITCPHAVYLAAIEEVLTELDTTAPRASICAVAYFRGSST